MIILCWFEDSIRLNVHFVFIDFFYWCSIYSKIFFFLSCISFLLEDFLMHSSLVLHHSWQTSGQGNTPKSSLPCSEYKNCKVLHALHRNIVPFPKGTSWRSNYFPWISHRLHQWNLFFCISASESMAVWKERERDLRVEVTHTQPPCTHAHTHSSKVDDASSNGHILVSQNSSVSGSDMFLYSLSGDQSRGQII